MQPKYIIFEIQSAYCDDAYCAASIYFWIKEIKCGRKSISLDEDVDYVVSEQLKINLHISALKIAKKVRCSISTVLNHLNHAFGLKVGAVTIKIHLKRVNSAIFKNDFK